MAFEAKGEMKARVTAQLRTLEAQPSRGDFKPFSDIVRAHLRGEILLAEGKWKPALDQLKKADQLEAPEKDKEYLARCLLAAAEHSRDQREALRLRQEALAAYSVLAFRPGLVWQWSQAYFPGYSSDSILTTARLALQLDRMDSRTKVELGLYISRHDRADPGLRDVIEAQLLWRHQQK
jgi:hypothetical protein